MAVWRIWPGFFEILFPCGDVRQLDRIPPGPQADCNFFTGRVVTYDPGQRLPGVATHRQ